MLRKNKIFSLFFSNFYCFFINLLSLSLFSAFPIPFILIFCSFLGFFRFSICLLAFSSVFLVFSRIFLYLCLCGILDYFWGIA